MAIVLNPINTSVELYGDNNLMCISEEFSNHAPRETYLRQNQYEALRAFFQAERDQELGWWRDPEEPDWVVRPHEYYNDTAIVYNERTRYTGYPHRSAAEANSGNPSSARVAKRYFAAHPDEEPKPWQDAKPGEVWVLTRWETAESFLVWDDEFITADLAVIVDLDDDSITAGHRIWPEEDK